jgi:hypothetical protein
MGEIGCPDSLASVKEDTNTNNMKAEGFTHDLHRIPSRNQIRLILYLQWRFSMPLQIVRFK